MFDFKDKNVVITGASGGIGKAVTKAFYLAGANVLLCGTSAIKLQKTIDEIKIKNKSNRLIYQEADLKDRQAIKKITEKAQQEFAQIDTLIVNAGINKDSLLVRMQQQDWDDVIAVNLTASFILSKLIAKIMMKQRKGKIVFISSVVGMIGNIGQANYAASKGGLIAFAKTMARELVSRHITVNVVAPGFIDTTMSEGIPSSAKEHFLQTIPMKRFGTPDEIAHGVLFLSSCGSSYITGSVLNISGGLHM